MLLLSIRKGFTCGGVLSKFMLVKLNSNREPMKKYFFSQSENLRLYSAEDGSYIWTENLTLRHVADKEYIEYLYKVGDAMVEFNTTKLIVDLTHLSHFGIGLRAAAVTNVNAAIMTLMFRKMKLLSLIIEVCKAACPYIWSC